MALVEYVSSTSTGVFVRVTFTTFVLVTGIFLNTVERGHAELGVEVEER